MPSAPKNPLQSVQQMVLTPPLPSLGTRWQWGIGSTRCHLSQAITYLHVWSRSQRGVSTGAGRGQQPERGKASFSISSG